MKALPVWVALGLVALGGAASAAQSAANAELGERVGSAPLGAVVNNVGGSLVVLAGVALLPSVRAGWRALRRSALPWWAYLGGVGGATFVVGAVFAVPVIGVAAFTIAQVAGGGVGGLAVDRAGMSPSGRHALTGPRLAGTVLGIAAVALAQVGRPVGDLAIGMVALAVAGGVAVALQTALNGRVSATAGTPAAIIANFCASTPPVLLVAALAGAFTTHWPRDWPGDWYLYLGGPMAVGIVVSLVVGVHSVGVLRTGLATVAGQLAGALLLDTLLPAGPGLRPALLAGAVLTMVAVLVSGRRPRPAPAAT